MADQAFGCMSEKRVGFVFTTHSLQSSHTLYMPVAGDV